MTSLRFTRLTCQFLVLTYNDHRFSTQCIHKTLNPVWNAVFDLTITQGSESEFIEAVCWDRDRFRKEYLGEFDLSIAELFSDGALSLDDPSNQVRHLIL
jgi:phosphatidylserine decarboxylase